MKGILLVLVLAICPTMAIADDFKLCNGANKASKDGGDAAVRSRFAPIVAACTRLLQNPKQRYQYAIWQNLRGLAWYALREDDKALSDFNAVIAMDPMKNGIHARHNRANMYMDRGDYDGALADMSEVIRANPRNAGIYYNRALLWRLKNDKEKALADINRTLEIDPKNTLALNGRGLLRIERGEYDAALRDFNEVIRHKPKYAHAYANRGYYWRQRGDLDRALDDLNKAVSLAENGNGYSYYQRAEVLRYRGELGAALRDLEESVRQAPDDIRAVLSRGLVLEKKGDLASARAQFERVVNSPRAVRHNAEIDAAQARETAAARLASYDSGDLQPAIPATPIRVTSETSIPTPAISAPIVSKPLAAERLQITVKQGRRVALIIGNSDYKKVPALANPLKDSEAIAASLRNIGFETVILRNNANREELIATLRRFAEEADKADWAMVYYAGHGIEVNGQNYLIPVDATLKTDRDVQFEAVPMDQVMASIDGAKKLKLIVLDACRDNPFAPKMEKTGVRDVVAAASTAGGTVGTRSIGRGLGEVKVTGASLVVFAAKHGQTALDGEGDNSPFAVALVQRIATPGVEINKIFRLVRDDVMEATAGRQEPYTYGSLPGKEDFFFVAAK